MLHCDGVKVSSQNSVNFKCADGYRVLCVNHTTAYCRENGCHRRVKKKWPVFSLKKLLRRRQKTETASSRACAASLFFFLWRQIGVIYHISRIWMMMEFEWASVLLESYMPGWPAAAAAAGGQRAAERTHQHRQGSIQPSLSQWKREKRRRKRFVWIGTIFYGAALYDERIDNAAGRRWKGGPKAVLLEKNDR